MNSRKQRLLSIILAVITVLTTVGTSFSVQAASWPSFSSSKPIKAYTISTGNNTTAYSDSNLKSKIGTIWAKDELYVQQIGKNSAGKWYCKLTYPTVSKGRKTGYVALSVITSATAPGEKGSASAGMTTYRRASSSQKAGSISKGDIVYKLATSGSYVQVLYNIGSVSNPSGWRMAWVTKDNFNKYVKISQTTNNSDVAGMTDVTAYFAGKTITLQSVQNGKYICADKDYSNTPIFCNRNTASTWENFQVSSLTSDGWVGFKALANNKYLSASNNITDTPVRACADKILQWECHRIYLKGNDFYIKAQVNNKWLCVRIDKTNAPLEAYGSKPLEWERLNIRFKEQGQYVSAAEIIKKAIENTSDSTVQSKASSWEYPMKNTFVCGNNWRTYYSKSSSRPYHVGIDIASKNGNSNVYAAANGTVVKTGYNSSNGYYVIIKHTLNSRTVYSFYAHLKASSTVVKQGQVIEKGQKIAVFGNTGSSSAGAHLHFAITDKLLQNGGYYGYVTKVNGDKATYNGVTYFNPHYVVKNDKLP